MSPSTIARLPVPGRFESLGASGVTSALETAQVVHKPSLLGIYSRTVLGAGPLPTWPVGD